MSNEESPVDSAFTVHALFESALQIHQAGDLAKAEEGYQQVLLLDSQHADAQHLLGCIRYQKGSTTEGETLIRNAIALREDPSFLINLGNLLSETQRLTEAEVSYRSALKLKPELAEVHNNLGTLLQATQRWSEAEASYRHALELRPDYVEAHYNLGNLLKEMARLPEAEAAYRFALDLRPGHVDARFNLGHVLRELKQFYAAIESYDNVIAFNSNYVEAYNGRAIAFQHLEQYVEAVASYDKAIALKPDRASAYCNRGHALSQSKQYEAALASYDKALALNPDQEFIRGARLFAKMRICDWSNFDEEFSRLAEKIQHSERASSPFIVLALATSPLLQKIAAAIYLKKDNPIYYTPLKFSKYSRHHKIRVGYFSPDFREHPVSRLTAELYEAHDRNKFEIIAFSLEQRKEDDLRKRLKAGFDQFIDVHDRSDEAVATLAREMEIDIAVDLGGFTQDSRPYIFAMRAAPIQVSYLGYLGTMGVDYIDYLIADKTIIPDQYLEHYSERIVYLPSYQVNDSKRCIPDITFTRQQLGLPEIGFVFCCFNNTFKITPATFDGWMRILKKVEGSVLFLYANNETSKSNLRKEAAVRGVNPDRLVFGDPLPEREYLARYRVADLFLDTFPYNAGTTASDALWVGLPVLSLAGETFASRMAASLLNAIHLPELITFTQEQYENRAVELATHPKELSAIRQKLEHHKRTTRLFNTKVFARSLETAYVQMYERAQAGLSCEHIYVDA